MPMSKGTEVLPADPAAILEAARAIGFPVLVKPAGGTRLIGPNCLGIYTPRGKVTFTEIAPKETGTVGVVSQSGGLGTDIIRRGMSRGLKFSGLVTVDNCADVTPFDRASVDELAALKLPPGTSITNPVDCPVGTLRQEQGRVAEKILDVIYRSGKRCASSCRGSPCPSRRSLHDFITRLCRCVDDAPYNPPPPVFPAELVRIN